MEQPGGREARDFLVSVIGGKSVDLAILTKMDTGGSFDRHGRIVAIPYLAAGPSEPAAHWRMSERRLWNIELEMVVNGWAWVLERYEPDERYFQALDDAQRHRRGIWAYDSNIHPWEFKKQKYRQAKLARSAVRELPLFANADGTTLCPPQIGRAVQQECRDRSRMPSSA
eukprot:TRINITY_DN23466_c0_g1_i2.p1 TRINITY_DN23466_c0_g1~~TRINITY_DN23466_c0_g1_i2.p1  ORF type:complete len:170 (-),score=37.94 TRINITY_DN23466_c0_g1_i2:11-520(-)